MSGYETLVDALGDRLVSSWGEGRMAHCPGPLHSRDDERASLSIGETDSGAALLFCHAGCTWQQVLDGLGLTAADVFNSPDRTDRQPVAEYIYRALDGTPVIKVIRYEPKGFTQLHYVLQEERWATGVPEEVPRYPYRLDQWSEADNVYIVEGEKDVLTLEALGAHATTLIGGAGKWRPEYKQWFEGKKVILVADNDDAGYHGIERIKEALPQAIVLYPPAGCKDITDMINKGMSPGDLSPEPPVEEDELGPLDWQTYEVEESEWLLEPYIPKRGRVLAFGAAGSLKSLWATWLAARLSNEGHRVAYFSLEMLASDMVRRLRQAKPHPENFRLFTKWSFGSEAQRRQVSHALRGYSLIVVDSWTAAQQFTDNDKVAQLDNEVFLPVIEATGASLLILDNVGHPSFTDSGVMKPKWARGASAKGDKMEITLMFERPYEDNNYCTTISVQKMRLDYPSPPPVTVSTPRDRIEFYITEADGHMSDRPLWRNEEVLVGGNESEKNSEQAELSVSDMLALARLRDTLGATEVKDELEADAGDGDALRGAELPGTGGA